MFAYIPLPKPEYVGEVLELLGKMETEAEVLPHFKPSLKFPELVFLKIRVTLGEIHDFPYDYRLGLTETLEELFSEPMPDYFNNRR